MRNNIISSVVTAILLLSACSKKLEVTPPNNIYDQQILDLLASGDSTRIKLVMGSMANGLPLLFNYAGGTGVADMYYTNQGMDVNRSLEGNDIVLGDHTGLDVLWGAVEYGLGDFITAANGKNVIYWNYAWVCITQANQMLNYLTEDAVGSNTFLKDCRARGLVVRAYAYNYLMENYQDAFLQGGSAKLGVMLYDTFNPSQPNKARASATETYAFIKKDLTEAISLLQSAGVGYTTGTTTDIDLGVANFLLARVSVWTGDWSTAIAACSSILSNYPTLMSQAQYGGKNTGTSTDPVFLPETNGFLNNAANPEVILGFPLGQANIHFTTYMNCFGNGNGGLLTAYKRIDNRLYEKIADDDYRKDGFMLNAFGNYTYVPSGTVASIPSYTNTKFAATHGLGSTDKKEVGASTCFYMRASEVLLMKAEAEAQSGDDDAAITTLNQLLAARTRSGSTTLTCDNYPAMAGMSALEMVQLQTRIELWGEGGREFYNNKRWNIPVDRASSANHVIKGTYPVSSMTLQIPENEMLYNPLAEQN
ncbi:MAG: RagB/SusD family nutrient uptake outer membrane protein [Agriterribacter sp.]